MNRKIFISTVIFLLITIVLIFGGGDASAVKYSRWFSFGDFTWMNNHYNYSNHDYGKDMLKTAEYQSIVMTEGGDNQVFGLLYFALAQNERPDIDFFDQKGNVFPRLYGGFIGNSVEEVKLIRFIRDFQLYSTGRPVYLTWRREDINLIHPNGLNLIKVGILNDIRNRMASSRSPHEANYWRRNFEKIERSYRVDSLEAIDYTAKNMVDEKTFSGKLRSGASLYDQDFQQLGPWYLKPTGLLFRVTPIRYAILDGLLEMGFEVNFPRLRDYVNQKIAPVLISDSLFRSFIDQLKNEGYLSVSGNVATIRKSFTVASIPNTMNKPMNDPDYWKHYSFSFMERPEAKKWDSLSRQIFLVYFDLQKEMLKRTAKQLLVSAEIDAKNREEILELSKQLEDQAFEIDVRKGEYLNDNGAVLVRTAGLYEGKNNLEKAATFFAKAADTDLNFTWGYLKAGEILSSPVWLETLDSEKKVSSIKKGIELFLRHQKRRKMQLRFQAESDKIDEDKELSHSRQKLADAYQLLGQINESEPKP